MRIKGCHLIVVSVIVKATGVVPRARVVAAVVVGVVVKAGGVVAGGIAGPVAQPAVGGGAVVGLGLDEGSAGNGNQEEDNLVVENG